MAREDLGSESGLCFIPDSVSVQCSGINLICAGILVFFI